MLRVLGRASSINVQKVMWLIDELGLEAERVDIGGKFGGDKVPEYLSKNPNGLIPTLEDGDFILWESQAIVRYIVEKYGADTDWLPDDLEVRGHANQWMDWYLTVMHPHMTTIYFQKIRATDANRNVEALNAAIEKAGQHWSTLDAHLADGREYLTGGTLNMGDIPLGCAAYRWHTLVPDGPKLKHLRAWWDRLNVRPHYKKNVMLPFE
ncbi:MAG: glutathione S-transferase family protein [Rhodospirillaceae bacterium]